MIALACTRLVGILARRRNETGRRAAMTYLLIKLVHIVGFTLIGGGLISVWLADLARRPPFARLWHLADLRNLWRVGFLRLPWLAGMGGLFLFEFAKAIP
jgi:hypothetical protein